MKSQGQKKKELGKLVIYISETGGMKAMTIECIWGSLQRDT